MSKFPKKISVPKQKGDAELCNDLTFFVNDRVQLIKEVNKLLDPKTLLLMAPECIKVCEYIWLKFDYT